MQFTTDYQDILNQIDQIDPIAYGKSRNYVDGAVTKLSPYISRGVISTKQVADVVLAKGYHPDTIEPFLKELAWRDYFQQVWLAIGDGIDKDIKQTQPDFNHHTIPDALTRAKTGIIAIDKGIDELTNIGYLHNHLRMYIASITCNVGKSHWLLPAKWMYYHLLDADWASNALSWQWVAGSFSSKKYFANQENINKYCHTEQTDTFLSVSYEELPNLKTPPVLENTAKLTLETILPASDVLVLKPELPTYLYNFYNLDPNWDTEVEANRVLLISPSFFQKYPVSENTINFILQLAKNVDNLQVYVGEFKELLEHTNSASINYKAHPTNIGYQGNEHSRNWICEEVIGYFPSFFAYWKKCKPKLVAKYSN